MAEAVTIEVQPRDPQKNKGTGSRVSRKLRAQGRVPAIVYGHKQAPQPISLSREDVQMLLKRGTHMTQLNIHGQGEMALIRAVQWDYLGKEIIHLDFFRVSAEETITTDVPLELHGTPIGLSEGGMIEQPTHAIPITCKATELPESIRVEVGHLHIEGMIHVKELTLPPGLSTPADPDMVLVHIVPKTHGGAAAPEGLAAGTEPVQQEGEAGKTTEEK
jgi:large subunit ribosomal protein L25